MRSRQPVMTARAIIDNIIGTEVTGGILGDFALNEEGDVNTGAVTVYQGPEWGDVKVITPSTEFVTAAGGG